MLLLQRNEIAIVQSLLTGVPEHLRIDVSSTNQRKASGQLSCARVLSSPFARPSFVWGTHQLSLLPQNQLL